MENFEKVTYENGVTVIGAENLNAIQDELIRLEQDKQDALTIDDDVMPGSTNPVSGGAVATALGNIGTTIGSLESEVADIDADIQDVNAEVARVEGRLDEKVDKEDGKGLSTNDFTDDLKAKLDGIEEEATKVEVDDALDPASENPVQNKVVHAALEEKLDAADYVVDDKLSYTSENPVQNKVVSDALDSAFPSESASGIVATLEDANEHVPVKSLVAQIVPVQEGSGDPSPDNVRPLSGWSGASIVRTGSNLLGGYGLHEAVKNSMPGALDVPEEGYIAFSVNTAAVQPITAGVRFKENTQYTFVLTLYKTTGLGSNLRITYTDGTYVDPSVSAVQQKETIVITTAKGKTVDRLGKRSSGGSCRIFYNESGIFEGKASAADIEAYQGASYQITWDAEAGTVYGGTLDVTSGLLSAYPYYESYAGETLVGPWVSSMDVYSPGVTPTLGAQVLDLGGTQSTYHLAPTEVTMLRGKNNVWADTGEVTVTVRGDVTIYMEKLKRVMNRHSDFVGKTLSIMGDSISTFCAQEDKVEQGGRYYAPDSCATNYPGNLVRYSFGNVTRPEDTWWGRVLSAFGMRLGINESFAGSMIAWNGSSETYRYGANKCMCSEYRINHLGENELPDLIIVYGGTNDINHYKPGDQNIPIGSLDTEHDPTDFENFPMITNTHYGAVTTMLLRLQHQYPKAKILCVLPFFVTENHDDTTPYDVKLHNDAAIDVCDYLGVEWVDLRKAVNVYDIGALLVDGLHPNAAGMAAIAEAIIHKLYTML